MMHEKPVANTLALAQSPVDLKPVVKAYFGATEMEVFRTCYSPRCPLSKRMDAAVLSILVYMSPW
jgi:hypothetical protein